MDSPCCALCLQAEETKITGALSTKDGVTAHQNCLLFSSGIFCRDSPQFDDLFGFSVDDVMSEVRRGNKLICSHCKKKGATAGCEVGRCKKSFHYPCAVTAGAKIMEDTDEGSYGLYCVRHSEPRGDGVSVNAIKKPQTSKNYSDATAAEKRSSSLTGDSAAAGPVRSSSTSKRRRSFDDKLEEETPKRRSEGWNGMISDSSSDSADADMAIFAPLEFDSDSSVISVPEQVTRKDTKSSDSGHQPDRLSNGGSEYDPVAESKSLLPPVGNGTDPLRRSNTPTARPVIVMNGETVKEEEEFSPVMIDHTSEPTVPQQTSASPSPSPNRSTTAPPETVSNPKPSIDSTRFWKSCNAAHCTQAVFTDFIREMEEISSRIQSDEASQEDYDCALRVMQASGKLTALVIRQQEELVRKRSELQKAEAAVMEVLSALKR